MNVELIQKLRSLKGWTLQDFADADPRVSIRSIQNLVAGHAVDMATVVLVARKFGMTFEELMVAKDPKNAAVTKIGDIALVIEGDYSKLTREGEAELIKQLRIILQTSNGIQIMKTESGSIKFTLRMTLEDAEKLQQAFKENRLAGLKATSVGGFVPVEDATTTPATEREILSDHSLLRNNRFRVAQHMTGGSSIICGIISFLPLGLESFSIFGILMACACGLMVIRSKSGYWLAAMAIAVSLSGVIAWIARGQGPKIDPTVALAESIPKNKIDLVKRVKDDPEMVRNIEDNHKLVIKLTDEWAKNPNEVNTEKLNAALNKTIMDIAKSSKGPIAQDQDDNPPEQNYEFKLTPGRQHLTLTLGEQVLFDQDITVPEDTKITCVITRDANKKTSIQFSPNVSD